MRVPVLDSLLTFAFLGFGVASLPAAESAPDAGLAELRKACFEHLVQALAKAPLKDVPWQTGKNVEKVAFKSADVAKETLRADLGGMVLDLKWKSIDTKQLASAMRTLSEGGVPDGKAAGMAAALLAADGAPEAAAAFLEKANQRDISAQAEYDAWRKKLGLDEKPKPRPVAVAATPPAGDRNAASGAAGASAAVREPRVSAEPRGHAPRGVQETGGDGEQRA